jgi:hypothetical protein
VADAFSTIEDLPPLRLTIDDVAEIGSELARHVDSGGPVETTFTVSFQDNTSFIRDSPDAFLANIDDQGERFTAVEIQVRGWTQPPKDHAYGNKIVKTLNIRFRDFKSEFYVATTDPVWGKGAVDTIRRRLSRYKPWYSWVLRALPAITGVVFVLPFLFISAAIGHEKDFDALVLVVIVLSLLLFIGNLWVIHQSLNRRGAFADTVILRRRRERTWVWLKISLGAVAFAADLATVLVVLLK